MRLIGKLPEAAQAQRFVDYLLTEGVTTSLEEEDGQWLIWVREEDQLEPAREKLQAYRESPDDARYQDVEAAAKKIRAADRQRIAQAERNIHDVGQRWQPTLGAAAKRSPITVAMIAICIVVAVWTRLGDNPATSDHFWWVSSRHLQDPQWDASKPADAMVDIADGDVWRIFAPMFLHLGPLHLLFNMMWLYVLGGQIESVKGKRKFVLLVLTLAAASAFAQAIVVRQPFFGGMSGVVYGLLGYVWMKMKFAPREKLYISPANIQFMLIWFVVCFFPGMRVANGGHTGGLIAGMVIGYVASHL